MTIFIRKRYEQADATFMTLFAWQKPYEIQWAEEDNVLYIRSGRGKKQFWIPLRPQKTAVSSKASCACTNGSMNMAILS